jgi:hypothetical protein
MLPAFIILFIVGCVTHFSVQNSAPQFCSSGSLLLLSDRHPEEVNTTTNFQNFIQ